MHKFVTILFLTITLSTYLIACSPSPTSVSVTGNQTIPTQVKENLSSGYPSSVNPSEITETYPGPLAPTTDPLANYLISITVPSPQVDRGIVIGRVVELGNNQPYLAPTLLLGELVYSNTPNTLPLVGYSIDTDPKAVQDREGKFLFQDIKPGKYAIVVWTPGAQTVISDNKGSTVLVTVEAGKIVDLGDVYVP